MLPGVLEEFVREPKHVQHLGYFTKLAAGADSPVKRELAYAVLPESCRALLGHDRAAVPVLDAPTVTTVIAWPPHSRSPGEEPVWSK